MRAVSSGAVASSVVNRSSTAATRLSPTSQPPATCCMESAASSCGSNTCANHATSSPAVVKSVVQERPRRRLLIRMRVATRAMRTANAASHHAHEGTSPESSVESASESEPSWDAVSDGEELSSACVVVTVAVALGVRVRVGDSAGPSSVGGSADDGSPDDGSVVDGTAVTDGRSGVRVGVTEGPSPSPPHDARSRAASATPPSRSSRDMPGARPDPALTLIDPSRSSRLLCLRDRARRQRRTNGTITRGPRISRRRDGLHPRVDGKSVAMK